jgi:hypothetical protein
LAGKPTEAHRLPEVLCRKGANLLPSCHSYCPSRGALCFWAGSEVMERILSIDTILGDRNSKNGRVEEETITVRLRFPPPSSNRTCGFPASGFHVNSRHKVVHEEYDSLNLAAQPASQEKTVPRLGSQLFRRWACAQTAFPPSYSDLFTFRPLRSTVVTRFLATMGLSDSQTEPLPRLCLPSVRWWHLCRHPAGSPRFLDRSVSTRRPLPPRQAQRLLVPITSSLAAGFISLGRTSHLQVGVTRPNQVRWRYSSQIRLPRLRHSDYPEPRSVGYLLNGQLRE